MLYLRLWKSAIILIIKYCFYSKLPLQQRWPEFSDLPPLPQQWTPPWANPMISMPRNQRTHILGPWVSVFRKTEKRNPQWVPGRKSNPWKLQSERCQERFFTVVAAYHRNLSSFGDDTGRPDFFVTSHSTLALIIQHTSRHFLSDHINHIALTSGSIGTTRTMRGELSTPSLKSTRCII